MQHKFSVCINLQIALKTSVRFGAKTTIDWLGEKEGKGNIPFVASKFWEKFMQRTLQNHHGDNTGIRARFGQVFWKEKQQVGLLKYILLPVTLANMRDFHIFLFCICSINSYSWQVASVHGNVALCVWNESLGAPQRSEPHFAQESSLVISSLSGPVTVVRHWNLQKAGWKCHLPQHLLCISNQTYTSKGSV